MRRKIKRSVKGSIATEFTFITAFFYIPVILGCLVIGFNLSRGLQVAQITRDTGHMYAQDIDLSQPGNRQIVLRLADGLNITDNGGNGVLIFSTLTYVGPNQCAAGGLSLAQCVNNNHYVVRRRIVIGNSSLRSSQYASPAPSLVGTDGFVSNNLSDPSAQADGFSSALSLNPGEVAYVTESYFISPDYDIQGFMTGTAIASQAIF